MVLCLLFIFLLLLLARMSDKSQMPNLLCSGFSVCALCGGVCLGVCVGGFVRA